MFGRTRYRLPAVQAGVLCALLANAPECFAAQALARQGGAEHWASVRINELPRPGLVLVHVTSDGRLFVRPEDVLALQLPATLLGLEAAGTQPLLPLSSQPGLAVSFDAEAAELQLRVDPLLLPESQQVASAASRLPERGELAVFGNYQLYGVKRREQALAGRFELGASRGNVSASSGWMASNNKDLTRLDTTLRFDFPARRTRLLVGDAVSAPGAGGNSWRFAGLQWNTELGMAPELPTFALPVARGVAAVPSTVDLYVNGALKGQHEVGAGPYVISDIPVPTGPGTVVLRIRDALGQEQVVEQRFLATPTLLPEGMTTHAVQAGLMRFGYGNAGDDYGRAFASVSARRGIQGGFTAEVQAESAGDLQAVRLGLATRLGPEMVGEFGLARGGVRSGHGSAWDITVDWQGRWVSIGSQARFVEDGFADAGAMSGRGGSHREVAVQVSPRLPFSGSAGVTHTRRSGSRDSGTVSVSTAFVSLARVLGGSLTLQVSRVDGARGDWRGGVSFVRSQGSRTSSVSTAHDASGTALEWQMGRSAPRRAGWGWQLGARTGSTVTQSGRVEAGTSFGYGFAELRHEPQGLASSASWNGGWLWAGGVQALTPPLTRAVAVIETPGVSGAKVYHDGQQLGRTDRRGRLVATQVRPFETNRLRIDVAELPLDAWIDNNEISVRPYTRGVVRARFATGGMHATFVLRLPGGEQVPAGARVHLDGQAYPVGEGGLVSLPVSGVSTTLRVKWAGQGCQADLTAAPPRELLCRPEVEP